MRQIIIGSSGFLGSNLYIYLKNKGHKPVSCSRTGSDLIVDLENNNFDEIENFIKKGDIVYFFAGISSPDYCKKNPEKAKKINFINTSRLIKKILAKQAIVIFASTDAVYSDSITKVDENTPHSPVGNYGLFKSMVEKKFNNYNNFYVARLSYVMGGDKFSDYINDKSDKKKLIYKGFSRRAVSINDVLYGLEQFPKRLINKSINFCGPSLIDRMDIAKMYKNNTDNDLVLKYEEAENSFWLSRAKVINMDSRYFKRLLGRELEKIENLIKK